MTYAPRQYENDIYPYDEDYDEFNDKPWDEYEPDPDRLRDEQMEREYLEGVAEDHEAMRWEKIEAKAREDMFRVPVAVLKQGYDAIQQWEKENPA